MFEEEVPEFTSLKRFATIVGKLLVLGGMVLVFGSLGSLLAYFLCLYGFGVDISAINMMAITPEQVKELNAMKVFQVLAGSLGMFLLPALVFTKSLGLDFKTYVPVKIKVYWPFWILGIALLIVSNPLIAWLYQLNQYLSFPAAYADFEASLKSMEANASALTKVMITAHDMPTLLFNIFVVALMPAICEEIFFRGVMQQYLSVSTGNATLAIFLSAIIFSGFHGQFYGFLPRVLLGALLGYIYNYTANIKVPILIHFINNATAVILVYVFKDNPSVNWLDENYQFAWYWVVLSTIVTFGIIMSFKPLMLYYVRNRFAKKL
jgi:membrane protease YdiL (CAAX protease family)